MPICSCVAKVLRFPAGEGRFSQRISGFLQGCAEFSLKHYLSADQKDQVKENCVQDPEVRSETGLCASSNSVTTWQNRRVLQGCLYDGLKTVPKHKLMLLSEYLPQLGIYIPGWLTVPSCVCVAQKNWAGRVLLTLSGGIFKMML